MRTLANHHPHWANPQNDIGALPASQSVDNLTIVLARTPEQEAAFRQFTEEQQNPASPSYHHWLTPQQIGQRFGPSQDQITAVTGWLQSQNLTVRWIAPSGGFLGFSGTAADLGRALHTELHAYTVNGSQRISVASDPVLPASVAANIRAIRGLYTIEDKPFHSARAVSSDSPEVTTGNGSHYLAPADFVTIYDVHSGNGGYGQTIGIVGRSRTDLADFLQFRQKTDAYFSDPTEVVPTAFGGVDPGPAYTTPQPSTVDLNDQLEAELDVLRAGSVAESAQLLLVVATSASGGIDADAQYIVQTSPLPANVMNISFGNCESSAGPSGVNYWDALFQQAAGEGISVFVSSGDSGASGCDADFTTPPKSPAANSPNYICSSSYATCVGGTEFNDTSDPSQYWSSTNSSSDLESALSYIPEGAWNEPLNSKSAPQIAASGGGVSSVIPTPDWQTGPGVPSARAGRYTPDLAFSASGHDGYFACFAAAGASCVADTNGEYEFEYFFGTSAAAPSMAGITALLNLQLGEPQGNLNPQLYRLVTNAPSAFHDVTVASSGVAQCLVGTPSMCNNSAAGPTALTGGQAGYLVTAGYDEVTGLGSLDVTNFLNSYTPAQSTPTVNLTAPSSITTAQPLYIEVGVTGATTIVPTGSIVLSSGSYTSAPSVMSNGYAQVNVPADALPLGTDTLTATYSPDMASQSIYNTASASTTITVTAVAKITPTVYALPYMTNITTAQTDQVEISIDTPPGDQAATGSVVLTSGSYTSAPANLAGDDALIIVPGQKLAVGTDTLTITYTPDKASASIYNSASGTASVTVTTATVSTPNVSVTPSLYSINTTQALPVTVGVGAGFGSQPGTGTIILSSGTYTSAATTLNTDLVTITIPAGALTIGSDTLTASYTPDAISSSIYTAATGSASVTVTNPPAPTYSLTAPNLTFKAGAETGNTVIVSVNPVNGFAGVVDLSAAITTAPAGAVNSPILSFPTGGVTINSTNSVGDTLTITTVAPSSPSCTNTTGQGHQASWYTATGSALAVVLLFGIPARRRRWRGLLGIFLLLAAFTSAVTACGGSGHGGVACPQVIMPGTTTGNYAITVTGTAGSQSQTTTLTLTVQ